ncbi:hypothetical protein GCM10023086_76480 [Streptomyces venetus]|uniref:Pentapeptide repeat-containing protein n=1 Tax=Streptomyces venetus TaxID=1701086 RepID=A0ABP8HLD2_9ACTN
MSELVQRCSSNVRTAFTGGKVIFTGAPFNAGAVDFSGAQFTGGTVDLADAEGTARMACRRAGRLCRPD